MLKISIRIILFFFFNNIQRKFLFLTNYYDFNFYEPFVSLFFFFFLITYRFIYLYFFLLCLLLCIHIRVTSTYVICEFYFSISIQICKHFFFHFWSIRFCINFTFFIHFNLSVLIKYLDTVINDWKMLKMIQ